MIQPHGRWALSWMAVLLGFAFGSLLDGPIAVGQTEMLPAPRAFSPVRSTDGTQYAGMDYDRQRFGSAQRRFGSAMPIHSDGLPQEGEIIYEGEPRFIGAQGESILPPPVEGEIVYEGGPHPPIDGALPGGALSGGHCESCGTGDCAGCATETCTTCGTWDSCGQDDCEQCIPLCLPRFRHLRVFAGVQGFKGPRDLGVNSNFGFHEGINVSGRAPFLGQCGIGYQLGYRGTQTRLHGDIASQDTRAQHFFTGGVFRRAPVGLQYGVAYDLLRDDLVEEIDFSQLRTEVSMLGPRGREIGFLGMFHLNNEGVAEGNGIVELEAVDQYLLFIRKRFENCGEGRLWGGFSGDSDGIFGGDFIVPLDDRWSLAGGFNYLIPEDDTPPHGAIQEGWNIGISLVWHWNCDAKSIYSSPFRPLFDVADNGMMIIDRP